jgi:hypothetical protein
MLPLLPRLVPSSYLTALPACPPHQPSPVLPVDASKNFFNASSLRPSDTDPKSSLAKEGYQFCVGRSHEVDAWHKWMDGGGTWEMRNAAAGK